MKHFFLLSVMMILLILNSGCLAAAGEVRIMVVSDLHYLSPSLYEGSELFQQALARGDGKAAMYSQELLEALLSEARLQHPDLLLITGDLTFNGELESHQKLSAALRLLVNDGIPVVVIPGNHDINNPNAVRFLQNSYEAAPFVDSADFRTLWAGMLAGEKTGPGFSGVYRVSDSVWLIAGDYSLYETMFEAAGLATDDHLTWLEQITKEAAGQGVTLISCSHQALLPHTAFSERSFKVWNGKQAAALLQAAGCSLNLSGHMHLQHIIRTSTDTFFL